MVGPRHSTLQQLRCLRLLQPVPTSSKPCLSRTLALFLATVSFSPVPLRDWPFLCRSCAVLHFSGLDAWLRLGVSSPSWILFRFYCSASCMLLLLYLHSYQYRSLTVTCQWCMGYGGHVYLRFSSNIARGGCSRCRCGMVAGQIQNKRKSPGPVLGKYSRLSGDLDATGALG